MASDRRVGTSQGRAFWGRAAREIKARSSGTETSTTKRVGVGRDGALTEGSGEAEASATGSGEAETGRAGLEKHSAMYIKIAGTRICSDLP